jgi:hypothetical protein
VRVSENRVISNIFGSKRDEVAGESRNLQNGKPQYSFSSKNIFRQNKLRRTS